MIFNEKMLIKMLKAAFKNNNLIYGQMDDYIVFGGTTWRGSIEQNFVSQTIYGEMLKLTGVYPKAGAVYSINKEKVAQYSFYELYEFKGNAEVPLITTKVIYDSDRRILAHKERLFEVFEGHIEMLDQSWVTDEEDRFTGPYYDDQNDLFTWSNDTSTLKAYNQYRDENVPELEVFEKIKEYLEPDPKYTFH